MCIIQEIYKEYIKLWNIHFICRQKNHPNSVSGQLEILYEDPLDRVQLYKILIDPKYTKKIEDSLLD